MNAAYRALRDPVSRVEYLLELEGMGLGTAGQAKPPADLFEEILELQEARMELQTADPDEAPALRARLEGAQAELAGPARGHGDRADRVLPGVGRRGRRDPPPGARRGCATFSRPART